MFHEMGVASKAGRGDITRGGVEDADGKSVPSCAQLPEREAEKRHKNADTERALLAAVASAGAQLLVSTGFRK